MWPRPTEEGFFFSLRSLELGSGVCPALPFLFISLAFVLFSWTQLQRVIFADERYSAPPGLTKEGRFRRDRACLVNDLNKTLGEPLLEQPTIPMGQHGRFCLHTDFWMEMPAIAGREFRSTSRLCSPLQRSASRWCW